MWLVSGKKLSDLERVTSLKVYNWFANRRKEIKRRANIGNVHHECPATLKVAVHCTFNHIPFVVLGLFHIESEITTFFLCIEWNTVNSFITIIKSWWLLIIHLTSVMHGGWESFTYCNFRKTRQTDKTQANKTKKKKLHLGNAPQTQVLQTQKKTTEAFLEDTIVQNMAWTRLPLQLMKLLKSGGCVQQFSFPCTYSSHFSRMSIAVAQCQSITWI